MLNVKFLCDSDCDIQNVCINMTLDDYFVLTRILSLNVLNANDMFFLERIRKELDVRNADFTFIPTSTYTED